MKTSIREGELRAVPVVPIETQAHIRLGKLFARAGCTEEGRAARSAEGALAQAFERAEWVRRQNRQ